MELRIFLASWCHLLSWSTCLKLCSRTYVLSRNFWVFQGTSPGAVAISDIAGTPPLSADPPYPPPVICLIPACTTALWCLALNHWYFISMCLMSYALCSDAIPRHRHQSLGWLHNWISSSTGTWSPAQSHSDACMASTSISRCLEFVGWRCFLVCDGQQGALSSSTNDG